MGSMLGLEFGTGGIRRALLFVSSALGGIGVSLSDARAAERRGAKTAKVAAARKLLTVCCSVPGIIGFTLTLFTVRRRSLLVCALPRFGRGRPRD